MQTVPMISAESTASMSATSSASFAASDPLWHALANFRVDHGTPALAFEARLARENAWSRGFADRVMHEYRRFLYLACRAGHPVTPSEEVDQAWHLHMVYTRSYWDHLCREVIERPLHHGPTRGGQEEDEKFHDWYGATLRSYQRAFGAAPPEDIWPPAAIRFGEAARYVRVNTSRHYVIPKRTLSSTVIGLLITLGVLSASGCATLLLAQPSSSGVVSVVVPIVIFLFVIVIVGNIVRSLMLMRRAPGSPRRGHPRRRADSSQSGGGGCSSFIATEGLGDDPAVDGSGPGAEAGDASSDGGSSDGGSSGCGGGCGGD